jgi:hypothetical protein
VLVKGIDGFFLSRRIRADFFHLGIANNIVIGAWKAFQAKAGPTGEPALAVFADGKTY